MQLTFKSATTERIGTSRGDALKMTVEMVIIANNDDDVATMSELHASIGRQYAMGQLHMLLEAVHGQRYVTLEEARRMYGTNAKAGKDPDDVDVHTGSPNPTGDRAVDVGD